MYISTFVIKSPNSSPLNFSQTSLCHHIDFGTIKSPLGNLSLIARSSVTGAKSVDVVVVFGGCSDKKQLSSSWTLTLELELNHHSVNRGVAIETPNSTASAGVKTSVVEPPQIAGGCIITTPFPIPPSVFSANYHSLHQLKVVLSRPMPPDSSFKATPNQLLSNLIATVNSPSLCDCTLAIDNDIEIMVSKNVLATVSPFFATRFQEPEWCTPGEPIDFRSWSVKAALPCMIHMYTGWVPGDSELPKPELLKNLIDEHAVILKEYVLQDWVDLLNLATMLELSVLAKDVKKAIVKVLEA